MDDKSRGVFQAIQKQHLDGFLKVQESNDRRVVRSTVEISVDKDFCSPSDSVSRFDLIIHGLGRHNFSVRE